MENKKNNKKMVQGYAIILFVSAFLILLVTAYSQTKFDKNIDYYQSKLVSEKKEKVRIQYSVGELFSKNKELTNKITSIETDLSNLHKDYEIKEDELKRLSQENDKFKTTYENLISAEKEYLNGNYTKCALLLKQNFDTSILGENGTKKYKYLSEKTFKIASTNLYLKGLNYYNNHSYNNAIKNFELSVLIDINQSYSDDCYYFLALCNYKTQNIVSCKNFINILLNNYPESNYLKSAQNLEKKLKS